MDIYVMDARGSGEIRLTHHEAEDSFPLWSPDGSKILFTTTRDGVRSEIYVVNADGSNLRNVSVSNELEEFQHAWSPDGTRVGFIRFVEGSTEVYVMNSDGSEQIRLTQNAANEAQPLWFPGYAAGEE